MPTRAGVGVLAGFWLVGSTVTLMRAPTAETLVNIGLGTASILAVQLFALIFNGLMRDAARDIAGETQEHQRLVTRDRVTTALRDEYHRRYATIVDNVVPLLSTLAGGAGVDTDIQSRARAECRRLRALFDQADTFDHALMRRIRPVIDAAEARGVDVATDVTGALPELADAHLDALVTPVAHVLSYAVSHARLVVTTVDGNVEISIVIDTAAELRSLPEELSGAEVVVSDGALWCLIRLSSSR